MRVAPSVHYSFYSDPIGLQREKEKENFKLIKSAATVAAPSIKTEKTKGDSLEDDEDIQMTSSDGGEFG